MKFLYFFSFLIFFTEVAKATFLKYDQNTNYIMESPHEISLNEDEKSLGKSKIVFTQDPASFFYILQTPPLKMNSKDDFSFEFTKNSFILSTKANAKNKYQGIVNFIAPMKENALKAVEIQKHGTDGSFSITVRISKQLIESNTTNIKTYYKPIAYVASKNYTNLGNDEFGIKDLVDSMNSNGEDSRSLIGLMNSFSDAVSNPKFQYRFNQSVFSPDEETEKVQAKMNDFLKGLPPLTPEISNSTNAEEFAKNASEAIQALDNGDTDALGSLLSSINTTKIMEESENKTSSKENELRNNQTESYASSISAGKSNAKENADKENEEAKKEQEKEKEKKKKQAKKDEVLQDVIFK